MFRRNLQIVSACVIAGLLPMPALAQTAQEIDVPSQPLAAALTELGAETGLQIGAAEELLTGKTSAAVNGAMTPQQALLRLLSGTGLEYRQLATNAVTVVEAASGAGGQITGLGDDDELIGEDIIVEGELQARSVQDTQTSVAVISGEELERRSDPDLYRVVERTPGITQSNGGLGVVIRGIPQGGLGAGSNGDTITVVVDGSRYGEVNRISSTQFSTWDLEQIEVLRGPQSTQSGRNALAGVVNIRSKDPGFEPEVKMRAAVGNGGYFQTAAAFNMPIIEDTLAVRFTTDLTNNDGFISNPILGINDQDEEFRLTLRGGVRFEPTDAFSANLKLTYSEESIGFGELLLNQFPSNRVYNTDIQDRQDTVLTSVNLRLRYDLSDNFWLASETTYFESDINQTIDPDDGPAVNPVTIAGSDGRNIEQEIRLHYESDTITAVIGGFYTDLSVDDVIIANVVAPPIFPAGTIVTLDSFRKFDTQNLAAFGEIEYEIAPGLRLIGGLRYDRETVDTISSVNAFANNPAVAPFLPPPSFTSTSSTFDALLPKGGVVYNFTDDVSLGVTVQRGYRAGGSQLNFSTRIESEFEPEFTWNYELAFRSQWLDDRLTVNANAFYTDWRNQQIAVQGRTNPADGLDIDILNAGKSRVFGGEFEVAGRPVAGLELFGSLAYSNTKFTEFNFNGVDLSGNKFPFASKITLAFGGQYALENGFFIAADANYQDGAFGDILNTGTERIDGRFLLNARIGYEAENWGLFAYSTNLLDVDYLTRVRTGAQLGVAGDPRQFGVVGQVNF